MTEIQERLFSLKNEKYAEFQSRLTPTLPREYFIGVRTPALRSYAKELAKQDCAGFLSATPHDFFEENQLHAFILSEEKDFDRCIAEIERFLPFINNWATCDQLSPKAFKKAPERLLPYIDRWIKSDKTYTVRFAVGMLMQHFLDGRFKPEYAEMTAGICSEEYYVNMMRAWYFATALAKQYDAVLPFITEKRLDKWTHNKAIQKAVESYRISEEQKKQLRALKV